MFSQGGRRTRPFVALVPGRVAAPRARGETQKYLISLRFRLDERVTRRDTLQTAGHRPAEDRAHDRAAHGAGLDHGSDSFRCLMPAHHG
jgi:hypothetical protein